MRFRGVFGYVMLCLLQPRTISSKQSISKRYRSTWYRKTASGVLSAVGFVASSATALFAAPDKLHWKPTVQALQHYLNTTGISDELSILRTSRLFDHLLILYKFQALQERKQDQGNSSSVAVDGYPTISEAYKYMRYATAVYGESMMKASEMNTLGKLTFKRASRKRISDYVGIAEEDIVLMDIDFSGDAQHLRHMLTIDHAEKKVILAIRGTFSLSELVVDAAGYSRPFCGGEAHYEMANMAERIWEKAGKDIVRLLKENPDYELILTGHSLGAGTAALMNIMCYSNKGKLVNKRRTRCFAFASPPVFTPLEAASEAVSACTNYIHENDVVPFVSIDSVRQLLSVLALIAEETQHMNRLQVLRLAFGKAEPPEKLKVKVFEASQQRPVPKIGAPMLHIPAARNIWIREKGATLGVSTWNSRELSTLGLYIHPDMLQDHFPSNYELALHTLSDR